MHAPHPADVGGLVDAVRRAGSVHLPLDQVPGRFEDWRRAVRRKARAEGMRVSIRRVAQFVLVENLDYEVPADDMQALGDVIGARIEGSDVRFDEAVKARRRARMRLVTKTGLPQLVGRLGLVRVLEGPCLLGTPVRQREIL